MDIEKIVNEFPTKSNYGFTDEEISELLSQLDIDKTIFNNALGINTGMIFNNQHITYRVDIIRTINIVMRNR